jgi:hypothetical protein
LCNNAYFNQEEVYPWPDGAGLPDWRVAGHVTEGSGGCGGTALGGVAASGSVAGN